MNRARLAWLLAAFASEHPERPLWSVTAIEFAVWARTRMTKTILRVANEDRDLLLKLAE